MKKLGLGAVAGVQLYITAAGAASSLIILAALALVSAFLLDFTLPQALLAGILGTLLHWLGDLAHQFGHVAAARRTGYPMRALYLHWFLVASTYPRDEPELPASVHIRRALGGLPVSLGLALLSGLALLLGPPGGKLALALLRFIFWENLLIYAAGALLPLGFTDGSTLLTWWPRRKA